MSQAPALPPWTAPVGKLIADIKNSCGHNGRKTSSWSRAIDSIHLPPSLRPARASG